MFPAAINPLGAIYFHSGAQEVTFDSDIHDSIVLFLDFVKAYDTFLRIYLLSALA